TRGKRGVFLAFAANHPCKGCTEKVRSKPKDVLLRLCALRETRACAYAANLFRRQPETTTQFPQQQGHFTRLRSDVSVNFVENKKAQHRLTKKRGVLWEEQ